MSGSLRYFDASSSQSQIFHFLEVLDKAHYTCYHVTVIESESLNLVLVTSYLLTQIARSLIGLFIHFQNRDLYMIVSKPPDVTLKRTKYIIYIVIIVISIFIARPSSFTSGWILMSYRAVPIPRVLTD